MKKGEKNQIKLVVKKNNFVLQLCMFEIFLLRHYMYKAMQRAITLCHIKLIELKHVKQIHVQPSSEPTGFLSNMLLSTLKAV